MPQFQALAMDYDGTIAQDGIVDAPTAAALQRLKTAGRKLVLVTGRELPDLRRVCPHLALFDRVVVENGAVLLDPAGGLERLLAPAPPPAFIERLTRLKITPLSVGRVVVATREPNDTAVRAAIRDLGLDLRLIFNKGAVMVLPAGIDKASGLVAALVELGLSPADVVAVGDAENDLAFMGACGCAVAVANALPAVKEACAITTRAARGAGVAELIDAWLGNELALSDAAAAWRTRRGCP